VDVTVPALDLARPSGVVLAQQAAEGLGGLVLPFVFLALLYVLLIRPQAKRRKELVRLVSSFRTRRSGPARGCLGDHAPGPLGDEQAEQSRCCVASMRRRRSRRRSASARSPARRPAPIRRHPRQAAAGRGRESAFIQLSDQFIGAWGSPSTVSVTRTWSAGSRTTSCVISVPSRSCASSPPIAGYLHDVGNVVARTNHGLSSAWVAYDALRRLEVDPYRIGLVLSAVGNHEEQHGSVIGPVGAAVILADKADVHRSRVRRGADPELDIHDRVNDAVTRSFLRVDAASGDHHARARARHRTFDRPRVLRDLPRPHDHVPSGCPHARMLVPHHRERCPARMTNIERSIVPLPVVRDRPAVRSPPVKRRPLVVSLIASLVVVRGRSVLVAGLRPILGLDLQGGISAVYQPVLPEGTEIPDDFEEIIDETIEIIRSRVDSLGVAEPDISRSGTDVIVQLPGVTDAERLSELIGRTAQLRFRPVLEAYPARNGGVRRGRNRLQRPGRRPPELGADEAASSVGRPRRSVRATSRSRSRRDLSGRPRRAVGRLDPGRVPGRAVGRFHDFGRLRCGGERRSRRSRPSWPASVTSGVRAAGDRARRGRRVRAVDEP
jgi:hypothetical protein